MTKKSFEIAGRVTRVRHRMAEAAAKAGRAPEDITLVGVTKTQAPQDVRALIEAGVHEIGENRVQELLEKEPFLSDLPHQTHLIGHLQRNKAKYLPGHIGMLQSLDSIPLLEALERAYAGTGQVLDVLIEVNIGEEANKSGIGRNEVRALAARVAESAHLRLRGLMAIPPYVHGEAVRTYFAQMFELFIDIKAKTLDNNTINVLSMGMSSDFEIAIAEGATMIRVGTELFGPRG